jgi:hypothetical protein
MMAPRIGGQFVMRGRGDWIAVPDLDSTQAAIDALHGRIGELERKAAECAEDVPTPPEDERVRRIVEIVKDEQMVWRSGQNQYCHGRHVAAGVILQRLRNELGIVED